MRDDLIRRQDAIMVVKDLRLKAIGCIPESYNAGVDASASALEKIPSAQPETKWIPVSEKLPDEFDEYMCTCIDKYTARLYTSAVEYCPAKKNPWVTGAVVIAWMEHPKPYEVGKCGR